MANGLYEAPKSNLGGLAELYMAGQAQVAKIRGEVTKQRAQESANLTDMIEKISLTGLQDADKMYNEGAIKLRNVISQAQQDNSNGLITRQEATRIANNAISQADLLVNSTELIGQKYTDLKASVKSGDKSQADLDKFENSYFGNVNAIGGNSVVTLEYGPKGLEFNRSYTYMKNGVMQTGVIAAPLSSGINPTEQGIPGYDGDDWAKSVKSRINRIAAPVQSGTGLDPNNQPFFQYAQNPINDEMVIEGIELMINEYTDAELIGVLYDGMSGRATYSPNYQGNTQVELDTQKYKRKNGDSLFHEFDANGKLVDIDFNYANDDDLFEIKHEIDGTLKLSDRQKQMAQAFLRKNALLALGVDYTNRFGRKSSASDSDANTGNFNDFGYYGKGSDEKTYNILDSLALLEQQTLIKMGLGEDTPDANTETNINDLYLNYSQNTKYTKTITNNKLSNFLNYLGVTDEDRMQGRMYSQDDNTLTNLFVGETSSKRNDLNATTINGQEFSNINGFGYAKGGGNNYTILLHGNTTVGVEEQKGGTGNTGALKTSKRNVNIPAIGYTTPAQSRVIYNKLKSQYTQFGEKAAEKDYLKIGADAGANDKYAFAVAKIMEQLKP